MLRTIALATLVWLLGLVCSAAMGGFINVVCVVVVVAVLWDLIRGCKRL